MTLAAGDSVTIPNGAHDIAATTLGQVQATLATLTAQLLLQQNTPISLVNPFDNGYMGLVLLGNAFFDVTDVNVNSLFFGPGVQGSGGAIPVSTKVGDFNKDGIPDLFIKVRTQDTGIGCADTAATLSGQIFFQGLGFLPFHSTVGFGINSSGCP